MTERKNRPATGGTALGNKLGGCDREYSAPNDRLLGLPGRARWAYAELRRAGSGGITAMQFPGVRLADAIFKLRSAGFAIETVRERHDGEFAGWHARYVLVETPDAREAMQGPAADAAKGAA